MKNEMEAVRLVVEVTSIGENHVLIVVLIHEDNEVTYMRGWRRKANFGMMGKD